MLQIIFKMSSLLINLWKKSESDWSEIWTNELRFLFFHVQNLPFAIRIKIRHFSQSREGGGRRSLEFWKGICILKHYQTQNSKSSEGVRGYFEGPGRKFPPRATSWSHHSLQCTLQCFKVCTNLFKTASINFKN